MQDILEMEQLTARDFFVELDHPVAGTLKYPGAPVNPEPQVSAWVYQPAPLLGQHTREILMDRLGYSEDQVDQLLKQGVI